MTRRKAEAAYRLLLDDAARVRAAAERSEQAEGPVGYLCPACLRYWRTRTHHDEHECPRPEPRSPRFIFRTPDGREQAALDRT